MEMQRIYRAMGLIAAGPSFPFVSSISFLRATGADSTLTLLALSLPSRLLAFQREGERYAASYAVRVQLRRGGVVVRTIEATEVVRVPTFRETGRTDESVIWEQYLRLEPGRYTMSISVRDEGSARSAGEEVTIEVPRLSATALGSPVPVYEAIPRQGADSLPRILARPRATVVFGLDSVLPVYVDAPGVDAPARVTVRVLADGDVVTYQGTRELPLRGSAHSATITVPVSGMGIGINTLEVSVPGRADTVRTRVLVSLGDDLPIATFDEMVNYLRYFTVVERLNALRGTPPAQRGAVWSQFLKDTDPVPATAEHEGLRDYFARIRTANVRYRDEGSLGWQTDRGIAYVALGDPDNLIDTGLSDPNARLRQQIWEYRELRLSLVFVDATGFGRWRLSPQQHTLLDTAIRRKLTQNVTR
jgi:GWxTD domain-containing protein